MFTVSLLPADKHLQKLDDVQAFATQHFGMHLPEHMCPVPMAQIASYWANQTAINAEKLSQAGQRLAEEFDPFEVTLGELILPQGPDTPQKQGLAKNLTKKQTQHGMLAVRVQGTAIDTVMELWQKTLTHRVLGKELQPNHFEPYTFNKQAIFPLGMCGLTEGYDPDKVATLQDLLPKQIEVTEVVIISPHTPHGMGHLISHALGKVTKLRVVG